MAQVTLTRSIQAPTEAVFGVVSDIRNFSKAVDNIQKVEFLSETQSGVGTRFRETRLMGGREASSVLEVTEFVPGEKVRLVSESQGTVWDSVFTVQPENGGTNLTLHMTATSKNVITKLMVRLMMGMVTKAIAKDMDAVKAYCEKG
ncbi:hypothetical protein GF324_06395 [bacterium]|nr:hypothetical protein [bacterium]